MQTQQRSCLEWRIPPSRCCAISRHVAASINRPRPGVLASAATQDREVFSIPESRDEAVNVSVSALLGQIKSLKRSKKAKKGFGSSGGSSGASGTRFSIELPLPGATPLEAVDLTRDILARLPPGTTDSACIVCASDQAAAAAAGSIKRTGPVLSLRAACQTDSLTGPLVLVEPSTADVALVEQLLDEVWLGGGWVLAVNPSWHTDTPAEYRGLVESFDAVYSFMPIATQGLMRAEGALLRQLPATGSKGGSAASPWRVLLKEGGQFVQVGQMQQRPRPSDLELVYMNARAASSPLTSLVKGVKGILDRGKQQSQ